MLVQRVEQASVTVGGELRAAIAAGVLILLGVEETDTEDDALWLCRKVANLRIFPDQNGTMNRSLLEVDGQALVVSQFTLHASTRKGNRPSYIRAAHPEKAVPLYQYFVKILESELQKPVATGQFGADMQVALVNDGPVTIWIDSKNRE